MTPEQIKALQAENDELKASLATANQTVGELKTQMESLNPSDLTEEDKKLLGEIANADDGLRLHEIEAQTGFKAQRVLFHLGRLQKKGFVLAHGGGETFMRMKLDGPGRLYATREGLI